MSARRALLLDRDGTLVRDVGYPRDPSAMELVPGAAEALADAASRGWALVVVSNQSGVARGLVTRDEAARVEARVEELFADRGVRFDRVYFCFHGPGEGCACRKPEPGMLRDAARDLGLSLPACVMVGDKPSDVQAGLAAGCAAVSFGGPAAPGAVAAFATWAELSDWLRARG